MASLGWIGMGRIGTAMALFLARAGHRLTVYDRDAVEAVALGPRGLAERMSARALVIDHTSIHPGRTREIAHRLHERTGAHWVDAPVSGSPGATLAVFLGGEEADIARVRPWVSSYAHTMTHVGPLGSGQIAKSCNQAIVCATLAAWTEVLAYARGLGLDPAILMQAVEGGGAESSVRRHFAREILARRLPPETLRNLAKDLATMRDMAKAASLPMPVNEAVSAQFEAVFAGAPIE
jgi:3-hydroxyisobutyrate dehydrogenase-like beta-hydroxyacid dehydrogenase